MKLQELRETLRELFAEDPRNVFYSLFLFPLGYNRRRMSDDEWCKSFVHSLHDDFQIDEVREGRTWHAFVLWQTEQVQDELVWDVLTGAGLDDETAYQYLKRRRIKGYVESC